MNYSVDQEKIVSLFMEMATISSPSFYEKEMMIFIENYLLGKNIELRKIPYTDKNGSSAENLIIKLPATDKTKKGLFFDAHADTVSPCENITPILDGDIIRSSGNSVLGADDKCGIASILITIDMILEYNIPHGELLFIVSSAEEVGLVGAQYIPKEIFSNMDYGIILDAGGAVGSINLKAPFHYHYTITVKGRATHAAMAPEAGINAIKIAAQLINDLPSGRISEDTVSNVGLINGGSGRNVVPDTVTIIGEFRSLVDDNCQPLKEQVLNAVQKHKVNAVDILCDLAQSTVGYNFDPSSDIIQFIAQGLRDIGISPKYEESCGGTNANIYSTKGIHSTVISVGMEAIHSVDEYIRVQDLIDTTRLLLKLIELS
ncbi:MAG: M20/M25/M40 family metallo-hydrolase [Brevinema sp.]